MNERTSKPERTKALDAVADAAAVQAMTDTGLFKPCEHPQRQVRRRTLRNGAFAFYRQCLDCGLPAAGAVSHAAAARLYGSVVIPEFDEELHQAVRRALGDRRAEAKAEWWKWYDAYIESDEWKRRRDLVLERAGRFCEGCRSERPVEVHHLSYDHVGNELLFELLALCAKCHALCHGNAEIGS